MEIKTFRYMKCSFLNFELKIKGFQNITLDKLN